MADIAAVNVSEGGHVGGLPIQFAVGNGPLLVETWDEIDQTAEALDFTTHFRNYADMTAYSWNIFRNVGDYLHLLGIVVLLTTIGKNRSVQGISKSTQILYFLVFVTRYLDLLDHSQATILVFFKLTYIGTSIIILILFHQLDKTYERKHDTCSLALIIVPCAMAAIPLANDNSILEILWAFSQFVEGFAMVPQYIFCYRGRTGKDWGTSLYVIPLGGYRVFYALNWIYKKIQLPNYSDIHSWIGGGIHVMFFLDFLSYRFTGHSILRAMVHTEDTKINEISDKTKTPPKELPLVVGEAPGLPEKQSSCGAKPECFVSSTEAVP